MSYITYTPNEVVYIKGIGYATLLNCGSRHTVSQMVEGLPQKKQSIYYDSLSDLFNTDPDNLPSKKSINQPQVEKEQNKLVQIVAEQNVEQNKQGADVEKIKEQQKKQIINIVQAKLDGNCAVVYTCEQNLSKTINIVVKLLLVSRREQIVVEIQISKTIDTLRKQIFQQIGEKIGNYYNIKLFTTNPTLAELSVHTKLISQYLIKDNDKIVMTAEYAFGFKTLPNVVNCKHKITITNNSTIVSTKPVEELKKADEKVAIPLPPPPPLIQQITTQPPKQKIQSPKKQSIAITEVEEQTLQNNPYHAQCNIEFGSGKKYWQLKIEKLPIDQDYLVIGICINTNSLQKSDNDVCDQLWAYQIVTGKKIHTVKNTQTNTMDEQSEPYGYLIKQNDLVGVLLNFKGTKVSVTFYKNSISCGEAFSIDLQSLKLEKRGLIPFVNIGGQAQVTLDSKAQIPLDSFRYI